jgi:hypothetical protein
MDTPSSQEESLAVLRTLVLAVCQDGNVESHMDAEGISVTLRFGRGPEGDLDMARRVASLLAQDMF